MLVWPQRNARRYQGRAADDSGLAVFRRVEAPGRSTAPSATAAVVAFFKKSRRVSRPPGVTDSLVMASASALGREFPATGSCQAWALPSFSRWRAGRRL